MSVFPRVTVPAHVSMCTRENRDLHGEFLEGALLIQKEHRAFIVLGNTAKLAFLKPLPIYSPTTAMSIFPLMPCCLPLAHLISQTPSPALLPPLPSSVLYILSLKRSSELVPEGKPYPSHEPQTKCHLPFTSFPDSLSSQGPFHVGCHTCVGIILL